MIDQLGLDGLGGASVRVMDETVCPGCAKELEALREQVAGLTQDVTFWNTTFIEAREGYESQLAAMTQERDTLNAALDAKITICGDASLAAAQARIKELREALLDEDSLCNERGLRSQLAVTALATSDYSSALDAALKAEREKMQEVFDDEMRVVLGG